MPPDTASEEQEPGAAAAQLPWRWVSAQRKTKRRREEMREAGKLKEKKRAKKGRNEPMKTRNNEAVNDPGKEQEAGQRNTH